MKLKTLAKEFPLFIYDKAGPALLLAILSLILLVNLGCYVHSVQADNDAKFDNLELKMQAMAESHQIEMTYIKLQLKSANDNFKIQKRINQEFLDKLTAVSDRTAVVEAELTKSVKENTALKTQIMVLTAMNDFYKQQATTGAIIFE